MSPPGFQECYICKKEFGSYSINIHKPQCLKRWHEENNKLPKRKRRTPPVDPGEASSTAQVNGSNATNGNRNTIQETEDYDLNASWPRRSLHNKPEKAGNRPSSENTSPARGRPQTATLAKPNILDERLAEAIDMTLTTKQLISSMRLCRRSCKTDGNASDSSNRSEVSKAGSPWEEELHCLSTEELIQSDASEVTPNRPFTRRLARPSEHIKVPVITYQNKQPTSNGPHKGGHVTNTPRKDRHGPRSKTQVAVVFNTHVPNDNIPEPCNTCGRDTQPERFHSHPAKPTKYKSRAALHSKRSLDEANNNKNKNESKMANKNTVQKPYALKYRSNSERNLHKYGTSNSKTNDLQTDTNHNRKQKNDTISSPRKTNANNSLNEQKKRPTDALVSPTKQKSSVTSPTEILDGSANIRTPRANKQKEIEKCEAIGVPFIVIRKKSEVESNSESRNSKNSPQDTAFYIIDDRRTSTAGPRTLVCYICGREFGTSSLPIHEPRCLEKWQRENSQLPRRKRRPLPERPARPMTMEQWNEFAWKAAQDQLIPCENCGRTFFPDRLEVHQRGCRPASPPRPPRSHGHTSPTKNPDPASSTGSARKVAVICYICGRQFGSASITIHEPQCLKKWQTENEKLPEHLKREEPKKPETVVKTDGEVDYEATYNAIWQAHLDQLVPCRNCGRTFFPDRLKKHANSCKSMSSSPTKRTR